MELNFLAIFVAALTTLVVGFFWYSNMLFGKAWQRESGLTDDKLRGGNLAIIYGLTFVFSFLIAFSMQSITIHQFAAVGMVGGDPTTAKQSYTDFMNDYGTAFRTFKHGALHGTILAVMFVFPLIAINGMFERKSWKYIFINAGYWVVSLAIMGGIVCGWV